MTPLVDVHQLRFSYGRASRGSGDADGGQLALKGIDLRIDRGSTVGIVGESGSGKSTLARLLCGLLPVTAGTVSYDGRSISDWLHAEPRNFRRRNQIIFQSPANSLDPRMRIRTSLAEPIKALERRPPHEDELNTMLAQVGLSPEVLDRYPHQLSGGQLQRVAIARALLPQPEIVYADEPTSALDVSVQGQVLNLLMSLRARLGLTLVMVSHDLAVISRLCDHLVVMKNGEIVESGSTIEIIRRPESAYTATLLAAAESVSLSNTTPNASTATESADTRS